MQLRGGAENASTKVLTVRGTMFIDGSAKIENGATNSYTGQGVTTTFKFQEDGEIDPASVAIWAYKVQGGKMHVAGHSNGGLSAFHVASKYPNYFATVTGYPGLLDGLVIYNRALLDLARHYGFQPRACRPYRAKTKGKVERPFRYIREDFFLARSFRDLDDLNAQLRYWLDTVANPRVHATTRRVVNEAFAEERPALKPLPLAP